MEIIILLIFVIAGLGWILVNFVLPLIIAILIIWAVLAVLGVRFG